MKKLFTLLMLMVLSIGGAWATDETEKSNNGTGSSNVDEVGISYTISGTFIAGGGQQKTPMVNKGIKARTNKEGHKLVWNVNPGYTIKSIKIAGYANDATEIATAVSATVDDDDTNLLASSVEFPNKNASEAVSFEIIGIEAKDNITINFDESSHSQVILAFEITYEKGEVPVQVIDSIIIGELVLADNDLIQLLETKSMTLDGSVFNGVPGLTVGLSSGSTSVDRTFSNDNKSVGYEFTINETDKYSITVDNIARTYEKVGTIVQYDGATGQNTPTLTSNGIVLSMDAADKNLQNGSGSVTLSGTKCTPIKLSTGCGVNVKLPEGAVATKLIVYGWSNSNNGQLTVLSESEGSEKSVDVSNDIFYSGNTDDDIYPSVYEYELDNWSSIYFTAGGSASQPFIVFDIVLAPQTVAISDAKFATCVAGSNLDFAGTDVTAYAVTNVTATTVELTEVEKVAKGQVVVVGAAEAGEYEIPAATEEFTATESLMKSSDTDVDVDTENYYIVADGEEGVGFYLVKTGTAIPAGKGYLVVESAAKFIGLGLDATGINEVKTSAENNGEIYNLNGQRVATPAKGLYIMNGKKVIFK